jgi:hypothetical protein
MRGSEVNRRGRVLFSAMAMVVAAGLISSCVVRQLPPPPQRDPSESGDGDQSTGSPSVPRCTALAVRSCALPYPSDEFSVADSTTTTGRRLVAPDSGQVPASLLKQLGPGAGMSNAFGGAEVGVKDGFSALSPVIFEVDQTIPEGAIPEDGGDVVKVFDASTGAAVPIRVDLPVDAALRNAPRTIVMAWPKFRWDYGHTYVARIAKVRGQVAAPKPAQGMAWSVPWVDGLRSTLEQIDDLGWSELLSATRFTVGSRANAIGGLEHMAEVARAEDHPVRALVSNSPALVAGTSAMITGQVAISDFRDEDGIVRPFSTPKQKWVPFLLTVPAKPAGENGAPVAIYGHGLTINKESMFLVAAMNARKGVATLGIDIPNHGWRSSEGGYLLELTTPHRLGRLVNMPMQGIVDHVSLVRALQDHLAGMDLAPWNPTKPAGDGKVDLDPSVLLYEGTSMGAVLGAAEVALIPEIDAAYLQVPGAGVADIIMHSLLWIVFQGVLPRGASAGDVAALMGAATMLLDPTDPTYLLEGLGASGRPVFAQLGVDDGIVPTPTGERFVHLLGLPRVGKALSDIEAPYAGESIPADGRGFVDIWANNSNPTTKGFMAHVSFMERRSERFLSAWLDQRLAVELNSPG